jgi:hypothetical protein
VLFYFLGILFFSDCQNEKRKKQHTPNTPIAHGDFFLNKKEEESAFPCIYFCMYIQARDGLKRPAVQLPS